MQYKLIFHADSGGEDGLVFYCFAVGERGKIFSNNFGDLVVD
jgi:hypothetical protein